MSSKKSSSNIPVALTIAGSDSGGGAGIQADLKTFAALGVHGTCAITCLTAQNPKRVSRIEPCSPKMVRAQLESAVDGFKVGAAKTGMLYSPAIIREVVQFFKQHRHIPLVVDPVMVATSGRRLLHADAGKTLTRELLPLAVLATPNLSEAEILLGRKITSPEQMRQAAKEICEQYGCPTLVKGGHLSGSSEAIDFLYDGRDEWMFSTPFIKTGPLHGTGCTYSAAITARLAGADDLIEATSRAKEYIVHVIARKLHF